MAQFVKKQWADGYTAGTPITAAELNRIEDGVLEAVRTATNALLPTGTIITFAGVTVPTGWLECRGQDVLRSDYPRLWAALGPTYGNGNGVTTFTLPNLQGRFPLGAVANHRLGSVGGEEAHALTVDEMPAHQHDVCGTNNVWAGVGIWKTNVGAGTGWQGASGSAEGELARLTTKRVGGSASHNNMPPFQVIRFIIKAE